MERRLFMESYVIIGGGNAGVSAAQAIREIDKASSLCIITDEHDLPYRRPMLTKNFSGIDSSNPYAMHDEAWYEALAIELCHDSALGIDLAGKTVSLASGSSRSFSKLIIASGSRCFIPPFAGSDSANVVSIRKTDDVRRLSGILKDSASAAVIGGGVLGIEAAWEMRKMGKAVSVIEAAPALMPRNLDRDAAAIILSKAKEQGVNIILAAKTASIGTDGVTLEGGSLVPGDAVVLSCGVRSNISLAQEAGIACDRAIIVDDHMRTSVPDVYACGDCAQYSGFCAGIWPVAGAEGKVAGTNAAGGDCLYAPKAYAMMMNALGTGLYSAGKIASEGAQSKTIETPSVWIRLYYTDSKLTGFIMIGDTKKAFGLSPLLERGASEEEVSSFLK